MREPKEQGDAEEQQNQLQLMFQTLTCKLKVTFRRKKIQSSGNRSACKEALDRYVQLSIDEWHELGAEDVIPKWDPMKHKACSMEVDIMIAFDKQGCPL